MKLILTFFLHVCFTGGILPDLSAQGHEERFRKLDVLNYRFLIELNDSTDIIHGTARIEILFKETLDSFCLDLSGMKSDGTGMHIDRVAENSKPAAYSHQKDLLCIKTTRTREGSTRNYEVRYHGIPGDGLIISENKFGDRTFFGDNWPNRAHHWLPVVDHPSDKATVEFLVKAPDRCRVVSNGTLISESRKEGYVQAHWGTSVPLPTKLMVIGVSPFSVQQLDPVAGIPVSTWVYPQNSQQGFYDYSIATRPLEFFQSYIGPYPFSKLANVQSKTVYGGMENASCIFYNENTVNGQQDQESLFAHEIAHQWFGDAVSELNWHHLWLSEGFATYLTDLYLEKIYGRQALEASMEQEKRNVIRYARRNMAPIVDTTLPVSPRLLNGNSYDKAAWVLHMLRRELGEADFQGSLRDFYETYEYGNVLTADFQKVAESVSGKDLEHFFRQWFYRPGHPVLSFRYKQRGKRVILTIRQHQEGGAFAFPVEIEFRDQSGNSVREVLKVTSVRQVYKLRPGFKPSAVTEDPDRWLLYERYR